MHQMMNIHDWPLPPLQINTQMCFQEENREGWKGRVDTEIRVPELDPHVLPFLGLSPWQAKRKHVKFGEIWK